MVASNAGHWLSGSEGTIALTWAVREQVQLPAARLVWELKLDGATLSRGAIDLEVPGARADGLAGQVGLRCPQVRVRSTLRWVWRLEGRADAKELDRGEVLIHAYPTDLTAGWQRLLRGHEVVVVDKADGLPALLDAAKVKYTRLEDADKLAMSRPRIVLVGPEILGESPFAQAALVGQARAGASVMIFRQTAPAALAGHPLVTRGAPASIQWERSHPLVAGFQAADLDSFAESLKRNGGEKNVTGAIELRADEPVVAVASWPAASTATVPSRPEPVTALLVTKAVGQGRLVLCQLPLGDWRTDPRSQVFLGGALDYLLSRPEPTPPPSARRRPEQRQT